MGVKELDQSRKWTLAHEDQLRTLRVQIAKYTFDSGSDERVLAAGVSRQQRVGEDVRCDAVHPRVDPERTLPAPDVETALRPRLRPSSHFTSQAAQLDPLPAPLVSDRQLLRRNQ